MNETTKSTVWYREPWPWILMSGPAVAVIGSLVSAYLAIHGAVAYFVCLALIHWLAIYDLHRRDSAAARSAGARRTPRRRNSPNGARRALARPLARDSRMSPQPALGVTLPDPTLLRRFDGPGPRYTS